MSQELNVLHDALKKAQRQVDILCDGFNVRLNPNWRDNVNSIITIVGEWETTGLLPHKKIRTPCILYPYNIGASTVLGSLPTVLFNQFKEKFLAIIHATVLPALKAYHQKNPKLDMSVFKQLLTITIS